MWEELRQQVCGESEPLLNGNRGASVGGDVPATGGSPRQLKDSWDGTPPAHCSVAGDGLGKAPLSSKLVSTRAWTGLVCPLGGT